MRGQWSATRLRSGILSARRNIIGYCIADNLLLVAVSGIAFLASVTEIIEIKK